MIWNVVSGKNPIKAWLTTLQQFQNDDLKMAFFLVANHTLFCIISIHFLWQLYMINDLISLRHVKKSLKFHIISTNPPYPATTYRLNGVSYLQVGFTQHLELLSNTWSQSFECTFWKCLALRFYNLVYFNGNLIHMVLIHWCLNHQNITLSVWSDIHEDYWDFLNNSLEN